MLSYPRTGSRYLSDDVFDKIPDRIALLERYPAFATHAAALKGASLNRRSVDAGKVTDHHALIITECLPGELSADERTVYDMVAARLLDTPLDTFGLSQRIVRACRELGVFTVEHLLVHLRRFRFSRLYCVRNFGSGSAAETLRRLRQDGLTDGGSPRDFKVLYP